MSATSYRIPGQAAQTGSLSALPLDEPGAPCPAFGTWETTNLLRAKSERLATPQALVK